MKSSKVNVQLKFLPIYLFSLLPLWVLHRISDVLAFLLYHVVKYRRAVVRENLLRAFPEKSLQEIKRIERDFYTYLSDLFVEAMKLFTASQESMKKRIFIENIDILDEIIARKGNAILNYTHNGNWEWMAAMTWQTVYSTASFYQKVENKYVDELMLNNRSRYGCALVESHLAFRWVIKQLAKQPYLYFLSSDQSPTPHSVYQWVNFFGQPTAFFSGVNKVQQLTKAEVFYCHHTRHKRGYYSIRLYKLDNDKDLVEQYAKHLEASIRQDPAIWLWSHKRWKMKPPDDLQI